MQPDVLVKNIGKNVIQAVEYAILFNINIHYPVNGRHVSFQV